MAAFGRAATATVLWMFHSVPRKTKKFDLKSFGKTLK
jgi:hypothetical protein